MSILKKKNARIRVVVADDNKEVLEMVVQLLRPDFDVIGTARDAASVCETVIMLEPDTVVLDISMPGKDGIEAAREMRQKGSKAKIVFLTVHSDPDFVRAAIAVGASAYVIKSQMATDLIAAVNAAEDGKRFISPSCAMKSQD